MYRFLGYLEQRPYLWLVGLEGREAEPAAELRHIPQGIDEVVALDTAVAVRCGPTWLALEPDLSGQGRPLTDAEVSLAKQRSVRVQWPTRLSVHDQQLVLPGVIAESKTVIHSKVAYWREFATWGPNRRTFAIAGSTVPFVPPTRPILSSPPVAEPSVLAFVDVVDETVRVCEGTFTDFCYPPAWSKSGDVVVFGAPFEPKRLYSVRPEHGVLERVMFRRHVPMPLLDSRLFAPR